MSLHLSLSDLWDYTDWERQKWYDWLRQHGEQALKTSVGPHGDGRFQTVGEQVRHIFSAEKRYVERLSGQPLTESGSVPTDNIEALFQFSRESRKALKDLIGVFPAEEWDALKEIRVWNYHLSTTPRKIVTHILLHEIRHWAQIATVFRLKGLTSDPHDFLASPVMAGESTPKQEGA